MSIDPAISKLVDTVALEYGLGTVVSFEPQTADELRLLSDSSEGGRAIGYILKCGSGSYFLKRLRRGQSSEGIVKQFALMEAARKAGCLLVPRPYRTRTKAETLEVESDRWWVSDYVSPGAHHFWYQSECNEEKCLEAGRGLKALHEVLHTIGLAENAAAKKSESVLPGLHALLEKTFIEYCAEHDDSVTFTSHGERAWKVSGSNLPLNPTELLATARETVNFIVGQNLASQLIHGDYHAGNLIFHDDRLAAIVDYEYLHNESVFYDLGYAITTICLESGRLSQRKLRSFIEGYVLDFDDAKSVPAICEVLLAFMTISCLLNLHWLLSLQMRIESRHAPIPGTVFERVLSVLEGLPECKGWLNSAVFSDDAIL